MEHRKYKRVLMNMAVTLDIDEEIAAVSRVLEMSSSGGSFQNPGLSLRDGQVIQVDFARTEKSKSLEKRVRAMVIYCTKESIGLMFEKQLSLHTMVGRRGEAIFGNELAHYADDEYA